MPLSCKVLHVAAAYVAYTTDLWHYFYCFYELCGFIPFTFNMQSFVLSSSGIVSKLLNMSLYFLQYMVAFSCVIVVFP